MWEDDDLDDSDLIGGVDDSDLEAFGEEWDVPFNEAQADYAAAWDAYCAAEAAAARN